MDDPVDQVHVLWGALVGGPDIDDYHRDITKDYIYNEVAVDYNAAFVGACAGLYYYYGTEDMKPVENFPPPEEPVEAFTIEALVNQENLERTQYTVKVTSAATQPPAYLDGFTARYYFNISELLAKGQSIDDITIEIYYDQVESDTKGAAHVTVSEPIKVDEENYYVEMDWGDFKFYGTRELQLGIIAAQDSEYNSNWDPTNDYSRQGLEKGDVYSDTLNIPLYRNGELYTVCLTVKQNSHLQAVMMMTITTRLSMVISMLIKQLTSLTLHFFHFISSVIQHLRVMLLKLLTYHMTVK